MVPGNLMLEPRRASQTQDEAIQDPILGKAGQVVWFLMHPRQISHTEPARHQAGFFLDQLLQSTAHRNTALKTDCGTW